MIIAATAISIMHRCPPRDSTCQNPVREGAADDNPVSAVSATPISMCLAVASSITRRKVVRSFATALSLNDFIGVHLHSSSRQLYKFNE